MKFSNIFKKSLIMGTVALTLCSCEDFLTIYPTDKTVLEDYWKTKEDVQMMTTGAYKAMLSSDIQQRAIIWGAYRSDELAKLSSLSNNDLRNITAMNLLGSNSYCNWGAFYTVINDCNLVLKHAPEVVQIDPEFTDGDLKVVRAQMLALRSLCYFYLVRAFRDVPYNQEAFENDSQNFYYGQSSPDSVLQLCIDDLVEAASISMKTGTYGTSSWKNNGFITTDAIYALLADIHLWRGSMHKDASDYQACVDYCDKVIAAKDTLYTNQMTQAAVTEKSDIYHLYKAGQDYVRNFSLGNSHENIFELEHSSTNSNGGLQYLYYMTESGAAHGALMASKIFGGDPSSSANKEDGTTVFFSKDDYRYWNYVYSPTDGDATEFDIRKMMDNSMVSTAFSSQTAATRAPSRVYDSFDQNWIIYRLTDVMLMKAEALVQLASGDDDNTRLNSAFNLVQTVCKRNMKQNSADTLKIGEFETKEKMELLVLAERERELCFEGKRWFDLVRFSYRHMNTNVSDFSKTLYQIGQDNGNQFTPVYNVMVNFIIRKYESGGNVVSYKLKTEPYLYFPIQQSQIDINSLLHQNPVYVETETNKRQTDQ